ncbi:MAG TPA: hypothetical protein VE954_22070 [Oligoflexus sp.]|uniref:hypothetical protein n=1 Tax=Oligoflexus sp. TaxID=1971216 RepID=UPI002D5B8CF1|nr:hypothetical protein [Oligoflexus sp.]HYX35794.1 hypothetical protein [Oligoflexus sp.]
MRRILSTLLFYIAFSGSTFAGSGIGGGGLGKELQEIALSETMLSTARMEELLGDNLKLDLGNLPKNIRSTRLMESSSEAPAGILIEVQPSDFALVTAAAAEGKEFVYRDLAVRATGIDPESKIVTMTLVDDPSMTVVVKDAESQ